MAVTPPEIEQAATLAAARVKEMLIAMLLAHETGEVAVTVGSYGLEPEKRVTTKARTIRIARGRFAVIEAVPPQGAAVPKER